MTGNTVPASDACALFPLLAEGRVVILAVVRPVPEPLFLLVLCPLDRIPVLVRPVGRRGAAAGRKRRRKQRARKMMIW
jgi:hypothetical protein